MKNSYYIINIQKGSYTNRFNTMKSFGKQKSLPRQLLHARESVDGTKMLIQGDITESFKEHVKNQTIEYLGDCLENGRAEQKVYDYLKQHKEEWMIEEEENGGAILNFLTRKN